MPIAWPNRRSAPALLVAMLAVGVHCPRCSRDAPQQLPTASTDQSAPLQPQAQPPTAQPGRSAPCPRPPPFDQAALHADVAALAAPALDGRVPGSAGDLAARDLITARLRCLGILPFAEAPDYVQAFSDSDGRASANLLGYLPGSDPQLASEAVVVAAHPDHLGQGKLGANDNASGVAALLAVAAELRHANLVRTVVFAAFGSEEDGYDGAAHFVAHLPAQLHKGKIVYVVNMDMVGTYKQAEGVDALGTFAGTVGREVVANLAPQYADLAVALGSPSDLSDHAVFCKQGIPYVFFWTEDAQCYHKACDQVARIDFVGLARIASLVSQTVKGIANSQADLVAALQPAKNVCAAP